MTGTTETDRGAAYSDTPHCPVCHGPLDVREVQGRKSRKSFIMWVCPQDGRHLRAFITYQPFVEAVFQRLRVQEGHPR